MAVRPGSPARLVAIVGTARGAYSIKHNDQPPPDFNYFITKLRRDIKQPNVFKFHTMLVPSVLAL